MFDNLYRSLAELATWPRAGLLFALFLLIMGVFELRRKELGYEITTLDGSHHGYSPEEADQFLKAIGPDGRRLYANTEVTLDIAFPLVYGALFASLVILLYGQQAAKYLLPVPVLNVLMDLAENVSAYFLASGFDGQVSRPLVKAASVFTQIKSLLFVSSLLLIAVGVVVAVGVALRR